MDSHQAPWPRDEVSRRGYTELDPESTSNQLHAPALYEEEPSLTSSAVEHYLPSAYEVQYDYGDDSSSLWPSHSTGMTVDGSEPLPGALSSVVYSTYAPSAYSGEMGSFQSHNPTAYQSQPSIEGSYDETMYLPQGIYESSTFATDTGSMLTAEDQAQIASTGYSLSSTRSSSGMIPLEQNTEPYELSFQHDYYGSPGLDSIGREPIYMSPHGPANNETTAAIPSLDSDENMQQRKRKPSPDVSAPDALNIHFLGEQIQVSKQMSQKKGVFSKRSLHSNKVRQLSSFGRRRIAPALSQLNGLLCPPNVKEPLNCVPCRIKGCRCERQPGNSRCAACQKKYAKIVNTPAWTQVVDLDTFGLFGPDLKEKFREFRDQFLDAQQANDSSSDEVATCRIGLHPGLYLNQPSIHHLIQRISVLPGKSHPTQPVFSTKRLCQVMASMVGSVFASSKSLKKFREVNHGVILTSLHILIWLSIMRNPDRINFYFEGVFTAQEAKKHALDIFESIMWTVNGLFIDLGGLINTAAASDEVNWDVFYAERLLCTSIRKHERGVRGFKSSELGVLDTFWEHVEQQASYIRTSLCKVSDAYGVRFCPEGSQYVQRVIGLRDWQKTFEPVINITFSKHRKDRPSQARRTTPMGLSFLQVLEANSSAYEASIERLGDLGVGKGSSAEQEQRPGESASPGANTEQKPWLEDTMRFSPEPLANKNTHTTAGGMSNNTFGAGSWAVYHVDPLLGEIPDELDIASRKC